MAVRILAELLTLQVVVEVLLQLVKTPALARVEMAELETTLSQVGQPQLGLEILAFTQEAVVEPLGVMLAIQRELAELAVAAMQVQTLKAVMPTQAAVAVELIALLEEIMVALVDQA
jgi:hypothetical protein